MNRETRRHPTHFLLSFLPVSKDRILDPKKTKSASNTSGKKTRIKKAKRREFKTPKSL